MDARRHVAKARERWQSFEGSARGRIILRSVRLLFLAAVIAYLAWTLTAVGWGAIWESLPTQPLFYVLFLGLYFLLPGVEVLIYRLSWQFSAIGALPIFLKKRIYNKDVLGYSGEVYFYSWARSRIAGGELRILETIRDNNVISSVASTLIALLLFVVFLLIGEVRLSSLVGDKWGYYVLGAVVLAAALSPVLIRFRRFLFSMPVRIALVILAIQCARLIAGQALQIGQWAIVMPDVPLRIWFTFAALSILLTRIPFLPNHNLIFLGAGIELSTVMDVSTASVASMLLVTNVLDKLLNAGFFALISLREPSGEQIVDAGS